MPLPMASPTVATSTTTMCVLEQTALLEVGEQPGDGQIDRSAVGSERFGKIAVTLLNEESRKAGMASPPVSCLPYSNFDFVRLVFGTSRKA